MWKILRPPKHKPPVAAEKIDKEYKRLRLQVFIGIFIGYAGYYLVRKNFTLAMPHLVEMGFDKGDLGIALSANAIAYGLSKFLMGGVSDRSNARVFLPLGLVFSINERGTKMSIWNVAHNVGGGMIGPMAAYGLLWFGSWQIGTFWFPAVVAIVVAMLAFLLIRDTPQSTGLPPIEKYRNDYPKNYSEKSEQELTTKEIFFKYVLNNKILWYIAFANAFVYLVRYGVLDWAPTYLKDIKGYDIKDVGWAYSAYEWAAIPGTIICGWLSDKVFKGRRAITTMIYMALVAVFIVIYWKNMDNVLLDNISLIAIGFLIYGPVMLIGVQALDLAPKKAAGTAAGLTGFFGYFFGTAILANIAMGSIVQHLGWDWGFIMLLAACALAFLFISFTYREEQYLVKQRK